MRRIQPDMPHFGVPGEDHRDFRGQIADEQSTPEQYIDAGKPAGLHEETRRESELARKHSSFVLLHHLFRRLASDLGFLLTSPDALGSAVVGDAGFVIRNVAIGRVLTDRLWRAETGRSAPMPIPTQAVFGCGGEKGGGLTS